MTTPDIVVSIAFLVLLGGAILQGRYAKAGIGETPLMYRSVVIEFLLNVMMLAFIALSIFLVFFYSWKLFLLLLGIGFLTEAFIVVPLLERAMATFYTRATT